jgi:hypothetical protein
MMPDVDLAARTETADHFHFRGRRLPACAEEFVRLVFFQRMFLVVLTDLAVFPADCPVLFGILNNRFAGFKHGKKVGDAG